MDKTAADIADLFAELGSAPDRTGTLRGVREFFGPLHPIRLMLITNGGITRADESFVDDVDSEISTSLPCLIAERLQGKTFCRFQYSTTMQTYFVYALSLPLEDDKGYLVGIFKEDDIALLEQHVDDAALAVVGKCAWIAVDLSLEVSELHTRVRHLLAEGDSILMSHSEAVNSAVQEREERLQQQIDFDARLNCVLKAAADGILVTDESGIIESFNPAAEKIFQYSASDIIGQNIVKLIPSLKKENELGNKSILRWAIIPEQSKNIRREVDGIRKDFTICPLELSISSIMVDEKYVFTVIVRDITERRKSESELQRLHLQNRLILDSAGEGIFGTDRVGQIIFANPAAAKMLASTPGELIGKSVHDAIQHTRWDGTPRSREDDPILSTILDGQIRVLSSELFWNCAGTSFPVQCTCTPIIEGYEITGAVVTFADISERRLLEAQLAQAQKLESIGQLAAGIAHEINTPTQYIGDNTRFLRTAFEELRPLLLDCNEMDKSGESMASLSLPPKLLEFLRNCDIDYYLNEIPSAIDQSLEGLERVGIIVRSMKEFSHPGSNTKQAIDLNRAIESTLTVCRNEWKYVADLQLDLSPDLPPVTCLPGDMNQVILNLVVNAAHAIESKLGDSPQQKGLLTVRTKQEGDQALIQIQDSGSGIPENIRNKIFDPFFTTKKVGRGTGQGLAIVKNIVTERHGGSVSFDTGIGQGTTFNIRIPIQPPVTEQTAEQEDSEPK